MIQDLKTKHAEARMQQRAIPPLMVDLLHRYGREDYQNGSSICYLDKRGSQRALKALRETLDRFEKLSNTYVVLSADDGTEITIGHRTKRIRRK